MSRRTTPPTTHTRLPAPSVTAAMAAATLTLLFAVGLMFSFMGSAQAAAVSVPLGTAGSYAVLAGSTVTNTGPSVINGNLGLSPGTAVTGFPPGLVNGTIHAADAVALQAKSDLTTAYNVAASEQPPNPVTGDLGGQTLTRGVYNSATSLGLTGALTLDAQGDPDSVWVFQAGSTLTTATASSVNLINGASACNVYWQIGSSATLGTASTFRGNILALTSITVTTGVTVEGRVLARNGAVTLDTDTITLPNCPVAPSPSPTASPTNSPTGAPTTGPTQSPTGAPTTGPTQSPTGGPTNGPTGGPTTSPTHGPTTSPTHGPTNGPATGPSGPNGGPSTGPPAQITQVPSGPPATGDGGSVHRSHPILEATGGLALLASMGALWLWRRERSRA